VIVDFGLSKQDFKLRNEDEGNPLEGITFCGTRGYIAPEVRGNKYTKVVDWWAVGIIIYEMLTGLPPFYSQNEEYLYSIEAEEAEIEFPSHFSNEVIDLISKFLIRNPNQRLQIVDEIKYDSFYFRYYF
jgi:serum/glucocorticoid-regulated kinase 2